ncbi:MAG: Ser-Thr-rich GPI-anchored membrane family protein [Promethearchaeota archaeon]
MKNIRKQKIFLCTLSVFLGFSMLFFTNISNFQGKFDANSQPTLKNPNLSQDFYTIANVTGHVWSPDGTKIAYVKSPNLEQWNCELWVAEKDPFTAELINHQPISSEVEYNGLLDWKDDWILYRIRREEGTPASYYGRNELWKIKYDGTSMTQVTFSRSSGPGSTGGATGNVGWGRFIPGTNLVYFHANTGGGWWQTFVCTDDGSYSRYSISSPDYTWRVTLSPTGNKLLWGAQTYFGNPTTHKCCNVDGSGKSTIKAFSSVIAMQVLADGNTVVWTENDNIYAIDIDGTSMTQVTVIDDDFINRHYNYDPSDVQGLLMGSDRADGNMHIFKIKVDGTGIEQLTDGPYLDEIPNLSPDGQYLSYLRLPYEFDKGSASPPYPYELVIKGPLHDLSVSIEAPSNPEIGMSYMINATVNNIGTSDDVNVDLLLYLDETIVESITIPNLPVGASETINYMWTPTEYRSYNFTAYTPPLPSETNTENNFITEIIYLIEGQLFNGMFTNYTFMFQSGGPEYMGYSHFQYFFNFGTIFDGEWWVILLDEGYDYFTYYNVDCTTRIMTGVSGKALLGSGTHDPGWIFTDISLGDNVPIGLLWGYEHIFNVSGELIYDLPGYGAVEVWVLEDLTIPGETVWYEKSTGILLNGTFINDQGAICSFNFSYTNVEFSYYIPDSLTITKPDSLSSWETDTDQSITWISTGTISNIKIELFKDGVFELEIVASTDNDGEYLWSIPSGLDDSVNYQIKVSDVTNPETHDLSENFEIFTTPEVDSLTITSPESLTVWEMGTSQDITWTSTGSISDVKIELLKDGEFVLEIVASTDNDGSYTWDIPTDLEDGIDYQIKISDVANPDTYDESSNFTLSSEEIPGGGGGIPSYNLYIIIGLISIAAIILIRKRFKLIK